MKKKLNTWKTIESLAEEIREELDQDNYEIVVGLLWDLAFKAVLYAVRKQGFKIRNTWPNIKALLPNLTPPLKADYTELLVLVRKLDKDARYADDDWEIDSDDLRAIVEEVLDLVEDVRQLAP